MPTHRAAALGTALVAAVRSLARDAGCTRLWLITTNDNVDALRFYQRRGFRLATLHRGAVDDCRARLKPEIPASRRPRHPAARRARTRAASHKNVLIAVLAPSQSARVIVGRVRVRPLTLVLCALALAVGTALAVALLTRSPDPPPVTAIELGSAARPRRRRRRRALRPAQDDDDDDPDDDPFDDAD